MVFCNKGFAMINVATKEVTILILIDGFLQYDKPGTIDYILECHNPYFNRWFSAMVLAKNKKRVILTSQSLF